MENKFGRHSPLPWIVGNNPYKIWDKNGTDKIAECTFVHAGTQEGNARFIVTACNSHYELLEACREALSVLSVQDGRVKELLEKVIAKAEGK